MAFDGIVTAAITKELSEKLLQGKIEKVYQPEAEELVFNIHSSQGNFKLYASAASSHARLHLAGENFSNPQTPMSFCMLLRKHLQGGRISEISQRASERVVEFSIETMNELGFSVSKKLIFEIMGKHSNIIVLDAQSFKIIDSIKRVSIDVNRVRQLLPGKIYEYPPSQEKMPFKEISFEALERICDCSPLLLSKALLGGIGGISPAIGDSLASMAGDCHPNDMAKAIYEQLSAMNQSLLDGSFTPRVYLDKTAAPLDFHVFPLEAEGFCKKLTFESVSEAVEYYYLNKSNSNRVRQKSNDLDRAVKASLDKLYLKKQRLSEDLLNAENSEEYRLFGELLTANIHKINTGDKAVQLINYYDGSTVSVPLDVRYSPSRNAQAYFKKYGKAKTAIKEKAIQLEETAQDIAYLETVASFAENAASLEETEEIRNELVDGGYLRRRKNNYSPRKSKPSPLEYKTKSGFKVLVGRNNKENDLLTFKTASPKDLWFHTKDIPGSHVILFTERKQPGEADIFEAAGLAAHHSKGKSSENVPVDYTQVRYVKKPNGAKPGMVIFTNNKTVYVSPRLPE